MRKEEEEKRANSFPALSCDEQVVALSCDEQVVGSTCTSIGDELVFGNEMLESSHQVSHTHDRHNKNEVLRFEEYCDIIAKMKSSHGPKMQVVPHIFSDADFPPLNNAAHDVKSDVCRDGRNKSTQHAYPEAEGRDQKHSNLNMSSSARGRRTKVRKTDKEAVRNEYVWVRRL